MAALTFLWFASTIGFYPLLLPDEGRYVGIAWHMLVSGDFITPRLDGLPFFHKPPLFYWLAAATLEVFGNHAWAGRLVSTFSATALVAATFSFVNHHANRGAAIRISWILAMQPFLFGAAHYANMDMLVALLMSLTVFAGAHAVFRYEEGRPDRAIIIVMYVCAALGFLAKGLIGVALPGAILFFWLLGRRRFAPMRRLLWWPAILLLMLLCLPWLLLEAWRYPEFLDYFFLRQQFQRFLTTGFNNAQPFWFYVPVLLALMLPWTATLWQWAAAHGPRHFDSAPSQPMDRTDRGALRGLMLSWLLVVLVFFSIPSSKLVGYVIAAVPPLAWFIQEIFEKRAHDGVKIKRTLQRYIAIGAAICLSAVIGLALFPPQSTRTLAEILTRAAQPGDILVMLDQYAYDVPFYADWRQPIIIVSNWDDPRLAETDNWKLELHDAASFAPAKGASVLWTPERLKQARCAGRLPTAWVIGRLSATSLLPELKRLEPVGETRKAALWHIPTGSASIDCNTQRALRGTLTRIHSGTLN